MPTKCKKVIEAKRLKEKTIRWKNGWTKKKGFRCCRKHYSKKQKSVKKNAKINTYVLLHKKQKIPEVNKKPMAKKKRKKKRK